MGIPVSGEQAMAVASHISNGAKAVAMFARFRRPFRLLALLLALTALVVPVAARGDIYKWTDAQGRTNFSNVPPTEPGKAKNVELVLKEARPAPIQQHVATPTEQALLARIENLERQLRDRQYATPAPAVLAPTPYASYSPPPPPPSTSYSSSGYSSYPGYYPSYTYPVATSYVVYPARAYYPQPVYVVPRGGFVHGGGGHGGHRGRR
jgi:hypothetical protein